QLDGVGAAEGDHRGVVGDVERHQFRLLGDARIAGRAVELVGERASRDLPGEGVFAAAGTEQEDIHQWRSAKSAFCSLQYADKLIVNLSPGWCSMAHPPRKRFGPNGRCCTPQCC